MTNKPPDGINQMDRATVAIGKLADANPALASWRMEWALEREWGRVLAWREQARLATTDGDAAHYNAKARVFEQRYNEMKLGFERTMKA